MEILDLICKQWQCVVLGGIMALGMLLIAVLDNELGIFAAFHKVFSIGGRTVGLARCIWKTFLLNGTVVFGNCVEEYFISRDK
jgi:hypothetical protein